jgi:TrmH family RNA methyltransferase
VVEGAKLLGEALDAGALVEAVYLDAGAATAVHRELAGRAEGAGAQVHEVQEGVLSRACDVVTPQPVAAVVGMVDVPLGSLREGAPGLTVVCAGLQDPGNAGAVIRSAGASGAGAVIFCAGSVDVYNPKAVRASAGALFHVALVAGVDLEEVLDELGERGLRRLGTVAREGRPYTEVDLASPAALILGNEAHGLPAGVTDRLDGQVSVPMAGPAESLNVAMAAAVLCFEAARQRQERAGR